MELQTVRLRLHPLPPEALGLGARTGDVGPLMGYPPEKADRKTRAAARRIYAAKSALCRREPETWLLCTAWQLITRDTEELIGEAGFKGPPAAGAVEIGYGVRPLFRNKGYMTEAVEALCRFVFAQTIRSVSAVCAATRKDNLASQRVLQKCGFGRSGTRGRLLMWEKRVLSSELQGDA